MITYPVLAYDGTLLGHFHVPSTPVEGSLVHLAGTNRFFQFNFGYGDSSNFTETATPPTLHLIK